MNKKNEDKFVVRMVKIYMWKEVDEDEVNGALNRLFGRSGEDIEMGVDGQMTSIYISPSTTSFRRSLGRSPKSKSRKVEPDA